MAMLTIERSGGVAGIGTAGSRVRSRGTVALEALAAADRAAVDGLFAGSGQPQQHPDGFVYRLTREDGATVVVPEGRLPAALAAAVHDEIM